jgi:hypothetical protein
LVIGDKMTKEGQDKNSLRGFSRRTMFGIGATLVTAALAGVDAKARDTARNVQMRPGGGQVIFDAGLTGTQNAAVEEVADDRLIGWRGGWLRAHRMEF